MNDLQPHNQTKLFGLSKFMNDLVRLNVQSNLPNKILLSGPKGIGKSTLAYHFINFVLSKDEKFKYDLNKFQINPENKTFKTTLNKSNPNLIVIDIESEKKNIDINQIRKLILDLNKSSFNNKPRFVLIDNIEYLNVNSVNALLKVLEEPNSNIFFLLINSNKKILSTLSSRCINFKINLSHQESKTISEQIFNANLNDIINKDLVNYYSTPGSIFHLVKLGKINDYNLIDLNLKKLLKTLIQDNHYKKDNHVRYMIYDLIEFYFNKINFLLSDKVFNRYSYFLNRISDTKNYNLDIETLFNEFYEEILSE